MSTYAVVLAIHVIVAVLGAGGVAAVAIVASTARRSPGAAASLPALLRWSAASLGVMFLSGAALEWTVGGAYHESGWFRGSVVLLVATGALNALARRALRRGDPVVRVERLAYGMCALVAAIVVLMEVKP